jgi:hypothetical protein
MCNAVNECDVLFSLRTVFSIGFSDGVFNEACAYRGNRLRGGIVILDWTTDWREWEQQMGWGERVFVAW